MSHIFSINMIVRLLQNIVWVANALLLFLQFLKIDLCDILFIASEETTKRIQYLDCFSLHNIFFMTSLGISIISWLKSVEWER